MRLPTTSRFRWRSSSSKWCQHRSRTQPFAAKDARKSPAASRRRPVACLAVPGQIAKLRAVERDKSRADEGHVGLSSPT